MAKILIADDDPDLLDIIEFRLVAEGHEVITATDGAIALELIKKHIPQLCILDVMMPRLSGFDVLTSVRADKNIKCIKIIMLTASVSESDIEKGFELGADDYLAKPFNQTELRSRIKLQLRA